MSWILAMVFWIAARQSAGTDETTKELVAIEHGLANAWMSKDRAFIERALSDDWAVVDAGGEIRSKNDVLQEFDRGELRVDTAKVEDLDVRSFGDVAVVRGRSQSTGAYRGVSMSVSLRFTDVFLKTNGRWLCIASQATLLPPP